MSTEVFTAPASAKHRASAFFAIAAIVFAAAILIVLGAMSVANAAASSKARRSQTVTYTILQLRTADGAATLYAGIRDAARNVSSPFGNDRAADTVQRYRACVDRAVASAVERVGNRNLTAQHRAALDHPAPAHGSLAQRAVNR